MNFKKWIKLIEETKEFKDEFGGNVFICNSSKASEWQTLCSLYLTALAKEHGQCWNHRDIIEFCYPKDYPGYDRIQVRLEMLNWMEGYLLTFEGIDLCQELRLGSLNGL